MKVKINFDEVQKLTWEEIKFLYGLIKIITLNHISKLLNREAETFTPRGPVAGSFQHTLGPRGRASEVAILVSCAFAFVFSWYYVIVAPSLYISSGALQHTVHKSIIAAKMVLLKFFSSSNIRSRLEARSNKNSNPIRSVQNADCRLSTKYRLIRVIARHLTTYRASHNISIMLRKALSITKKMTLP